MDQSTACPHCGASIDVDAVFCRHCGSSDEDGWRDEHDVTPDGDDFDYDQFVQENFSSQIANTQTRLVWRLVAIILLVLFGLGYFWM